MEKLSEERLKKIGELFRNPRSGSKIAAAKEFGIDLTLTFEQLKKLHKNGLTIYKAR